MALIGNITCSHLYSPIEISLIMRSYKREALLKDSLTLDFKMIITS